MKLRHRLNLQIEKLYRISAGGVGGSFSSGQEKINSTYNSVIEQTAIQCPVRVSVTTLQLISSPFFNSTGVEMPIIPKHLTKLQL